MFKQVTTLALVTTMLMTSTVALADGYDEEAVKAKVETLKTKGCKTPTPGWIDIEEEYTDIQIEYLQQQYSNNVDKALKDCKG